MARITPAARYFLLVRTGDEVLDWREAVAFYGGACPVRRWAAAITAGSTSTTKCSRCCSLPAAAFDRCRSLQARLARCASASILPTGPGRPPCPPSRTLSRAALLIGALALASTVAAQGKDDLWEVSSKMEMPGMPMAMPAQINRVCIAQESARTRTSFPSGTTAACWRASAPATSSRTGWRAPGKRRRSTIDGELTFGNNATRARCA